jgi:hypothetical protein
VRFTDISKSRPQLPDRDSPGWLATVDGFKRATPEEWNRYIDQEERRRAKDDAEYRELDRLYPPQRQVDFNLPPLWPFALAFVVFLIASLVR